MKHGGKNPMGEKIDEIANKIAEDRIFMELLRRSSLTRKQAETLIFDVISHRDGVMLTSHQKAALRGVTKGSYLRTRKQALQNVQKSLFTLILLSYLGVIKLPQYRWFFDLSEAFEEKDWTSVMRFISELEGR